MQTGYTTATRYTHSTVVYLARAFFYCPNLIFLQGGPVNFLPPDIFGGRGRGV